MKLSIVMAGRNDGYGGDFLARMNLSLKRLFIQAVGDNLAEAGAELILVEWNPPSERPSLADAVTWGNITIPVRIVTVPPFVHGQFPRSEEFPLFEYIAKNVGIRRARGEFILATNPDILFSDVMIARLAAGEFEEGCFYRANRHDLTEAGEVGVIHTQGDSPLHFSACGDFTMMARRAWHELRGYPEVPWNSHVDSHLLLLAQAAGMKQVVLPYPIFHQHHDTQTSETRYRKPWDGTPLPQNGEDWGLLNHPEVTEIALP